MKPVRLILVGIAGVTAVAAFWFHRLAAHPVPPASTKAPAAVAPALSAARLPECPQALGANPMGGPCLPRALRNAPPDPGPENDKTLAGIDANRNGVRDDVERYILENFSNEPEKVVYLLQYSRAVAPFSARSMNSSDEALAQASIQARANACAAALIVAEDRPFKTEELRRLNDMFNAARDVSIQHLSTTERLDTFIRNERLLSGHGISLDNERRIEKLCDFVHAAVDPSTPDKGDRK